MLISERSVMKKLLILTLLTGFILTGCSGKDGTIIDSSSSQQTSNTNSSSEDAETAKLREQFKDAMENKDAYFPQLTNDIGEEEAVAKITTTEGDITIKLFPKYAPLAVENFLTHAKEGYYNGVTFHRVINDFMIQTGDPKGDGTGGESIWKGKDSKIDSGSGFKNEYSPYLYNIRGAISMANAGPNTNGSQFFINQNKKDISSQLDSQTFPSKIIEAYKNGGNPTLDGGNYTVFGQVIEGMDIVDKIAATETDEKDKPKSEIKIEKIEVTKDYDFKK